MKSTVDGSDATLIRKASKPNLDRQCWGLETLGDSNQSLHGYGLQHTAMGL